MSNVEPVPDKCSRYVERLQKSQMQIEKGILNTPVQIKSHLSPSVYMRNAQYEIFSHGDDTVFFEVVLIKVQE